MSFFFFPLSLRRKGSYNKYTAIVIVEVIFKVNLVVLKVLCGKVLCSHILQYQMNRIQYSYF